MGNDTAKRKRLSFLSVFPGSGSSTDKKEMIFADFLKTIHLFPCICLCYFTIHSFFN